MRSLISLELARKLGALKSEGAGGVALEPELEASSVPFEFKNVDAKARTFEGLAATWELDLGDDVIHRGAFKDDLAAWKRDKSRVIPLLDTHDSFSIYSAVGKLLEAKETAAGLWTKWEVIEGSDGDGVLERIRKGVVNKMSIGYKPIKYEFEESDNARYGIVRHLHKVELGEVSLVLRPMNPGAVVDTDSVKSLLGREKLTDDETAGLRELHALIGKRLGLKESQDPGAGDGAGDEQDPPAGDGEGGEGEEHDTGSEPSDQGQEQTDDDEPKSAGDGDAPDTSVFDRLRLARLGARFTSPEEEG